MHAMNPMFVIFVIVNTVTQEHTNKTQVKPDIPTKFYTCMSTSWPLGNVYTAKSCKGEKRVPDALKSGLVS